MLEGDLITYLIATVPAVDGRVHLGNIPQNSALPALAVVRIAGNTPRTLGGVLLFQRASVQIHAVGDEQYTPALNAANQTRAALENYNGAMGATHVESCRCEGEPSDNSFVDGTKSYRQLTQDFRFVYRA